MGTNLDTVLAVGANIGTGFGVAYARPEEMLKVSSAWSKSRGPKGGEASPSAGCTLYGHKLLDLTAAGTLPWQKQKTTKSDGLGAAGDRLTRVG